MDQNEKEFTKVQEKLNEKVLKLLREKEIRWISKYQCVKSIKRSYLSLITYYDMKAEESAVCQTLLDILLDVKFMATTFFLAEILASMDRITNAFQDRDLNYGIVDDLIKSTMVAFGARYFKESPECLKEVDNYISKSLQKYSHHFYPSWIKEHLRVTIKKIVRPFTKSLIAELDCRFPNTDILTSLKALSIKSLRDTDESKFNDFGTLAIDKK